MRAFIISAILFLIIIGLTVFASVYVDKAVNGLDGKIRILKEEKASMENFEALCDLWYKKRPVIGIFVNQSYIDGAENSIRAMRAYLENEDMPEFDSELAVFENVIGTVAKKQKFTIDNII